VERLTELKDDAYKNTLALHLTIWTIQNSNRTSKHNIGTLQAKAMRKFGRRGDMHNVPSSSPLDHLQKLRDHHQLLALQERPDPVQEVRKITPG
jgi:hypothetical protein